MKYEYKGAPTPHVYDSGIIYQDQGIQPHIATMENYFDKETMDATGALYAASWLLLSALIKAVEDEQFYMDGGGIEAPWFKEAKAAIESALNLKTVQQ